MWGYSQFNRGVCKCNWSDHSCLGVSYDSKVVHIVWGRKAPSLPENGHGQFSMINFFIDDHMICRGLPSLTSAQKTTKYSHRSALAEHLSAFCQHRMVHRTENTWRLLTHCHFPWVVLSGQEWTTQRYSCAAQILLKDWLFLLTLHKAIGCALWPKS